MDGKQQHTYQYDSNKHRLFTIPDRIITNNNKDIVVVDFTSGPTHNCPLMSMSSDKGYLIPVSFITLYVNISPCSDKTWRACVQKSHTIMCPAVVV
jgi:hypothetical protein